MKLVDFSIEKWKAGGKVVHRNGKEPRKIIGPIPEVAHHDNILVVDYNGNRMWVDPSGQQYYVGETHPLDLMIQEEPRRVTVYIYESLVTGEAFASDRNGLAEVYPRNFRLIESFEHTVNE